MRLKVAGSKTGCNPWPFRRVARYHTIEDQNVQILGFDIPLTLKKISRPLHFWLGLLLMLIFSGCSVRGPRLDRPFLPKGYHVNSLTWTDVIKSPQTIYLLEVNHQDQFKQQVLSSWKKGLLNEAFNQIQPLSRVFMEDVDNLDVFLNQLVTLYLAVIDTQEPVSQNQLQQILQNRFQCDPLTNLEIRFLMNSESSTPFARKPLSMLIISAHELSLLSGAMPDYPEVFSPYLRQKLNLPPLMQPENINLFATKSENRIYSTTTSGFIICPKEIQNESPKQKGLL